MIPKTPNILKTCGERGIGLDRRRWKSRLELELIGAVLASLLAAAVLFFAGRGLLYTALDRHYQAESSQRKLEEGGIRRLQNYAAGNGLSSGDREALDRWVDREGYVTLTLYREGHVIYDSFFSGTDGAYPVILKEADGDMSGDPDDVNGNGQKSYPVVFSDGTVQAVLYVFYEYKYDRAVTAAMFLLAFAVFILILVWFIHKKTTYIEQMEQELQILESGNLDYEVTVKGKDELARLGQGINHMRRAVIERQLAEKTAREANHQLVTAMSHDLRSPLTALIGYLDLMEMGKYKGEEQLRHFIHSSRRKSYQIKEMSDKLFEYFLVYGTDMEELELEPVEIMMFLNQTVFESLFDLESRGFQIEQSVDEIYGTIHVNARLCQRVFDNVFSNIIKYADSDYPVTVIIGKRDGGLEILIHNRISHSRASVESTRIGIKTCEKIMKNQNGSFSAEETGQEFKTRIYFQIKIC